MRVLLEEEPNLTVIAEASNGVDTLALVAQHLPDVVLMDIAMPTVDGIEAAERIAADFPHVRVIILSMHANKEYVTRAIRAGALGYVMKDAHISELCRAIETVMQGQTYLTPAISQHVINAILHTPPEPAAPEQEIAALTPRQTEILKLIAEGNSTKKIAEQLHISIKTAESHRANIMKRLDIFDVAGLTRYALRMRLIET